MTGPVDFGKVYLGCARDIRTVLQGADSLVFSTVVPSCPEWTVHNLLMHLVGGAEDNLCGNLRDFPSPIWSQRHLDRKINISPQQLLSELAARAEPVAGLCKNSPGPNPA